MNKTPTKSQNNARKQQPAKPPRSQTQAAKAFAYAEVALNTPVYETYTYLIPEALRGVLEPGHLVEVPFGKSQSAGMVLALTDEPPPIEARPVVMLLDPDPVVDQAQIDHARWMADTYLNPIGLCLWMWLPPGYAGARDTRYTLTSDSPDYTALVEREVKTPLERDLVALLEKRGALRGSQLHQALPGREWKLAADGLARVGVLRKEPVLAPPRARPKQVATAALAIAPDAIPAMVAGLARPSKEADLLETIAAQPGGAVLDDALNAVNASRKHADALIARGAITVEKFAVGAKGRAKAKAAPVPVAGGIAELDAPAPDTLPAREHVRLAFAPDAVTDLLGELRRTAMPGRVLRMLARANKPVQVDWVYGQTGTTRVDLQKLAEAGAIRLAEKRQYRDSVEGDPMIAAPRLTADQIAAFEPIDLAILSAKHEVFLLHGITGSGKTEVYMRAMGAAVTRGRTALYLVPEISLTPQTIARVTARFGTKRVGVVHSRISEGERLDTWRRAREGQLDIVVGARSALFTPLPELGAIILDEEHDASYKQNDRLPVYDARTMAEQIARQADAVLLLGSATPDVETTYRAERAGKRQAPPVTQLQLLSRVATVTDGKTQKVIAPPLPQVQVVDMRAELKRGNTSIFSKALQQSLEGVLARGEQAILFLNRRGQSTYVFCRDCGHVEKCPRCYTPLTYHRDGLLRCHRCNHVERPPERCPECGSHRIRYFGAGTQQVETAVQEMFPEARVLRWDADTASSPKAHEAILTRFMLHQADVLVGTQMVTKGLDLPLVTLVGVVSADIGLTLPDFRAAERTFQMLTQVAGRAGRGSEPGEVIFQTYQPDHYAIQAAASHDQDGFYAKEIEHRRELGYPPFRRMVRIIFKYPHESKTEFEAERAATYLRKRLDDLGMTGTELIGPAPCFYMREDGDYRWHLVLRGPDPTPALRGLEPIPGWRVDVDPVDLL